MFNNISTNKGIKKYFFNTFWMIGEKITRMVLNLFVVVFVARYLRPDRFGLLSYALSFVALFTAISTLGLDGIVVRNLVKTPEASEKLLGTSFVLKACGSIFFVGIVCSVIHFVTSDHLTNIIVMVIALGIAFKSFTVIDFYFQAIVSARFTTISQLLAVLVSSIFQIILICIHAGLIWFAIAILVENLIFAISLIAMYLAKRLNILKWRFDLRCAANLLRDSWPLALSGVMVMVYMRIDQVMIKEILGNTMTGYYAAAVRISEAWYFIPMAVTASLFPAIINAREQNHELYYKRMERLYALMVLIALMIALPMTFAADYLVMILFGKEYIMAAEVLKILVWAGIFVFLGVANSKQLLAEDLMIVSFQQTAAGCVSNILLNLVLIPKMGINGAAWATLISYGISVFYLIVHQKARKSFYMIALSFYPPTWKKLFINDLYDNKGLNKC